MNWVQTDDPSGDAASLMNRCYIRKNRQGSPLFAIDIDISNNKVESLLYLRNNPRTSWVKQDNIPSELLSEYVEVMGIARAKLDAEIALEEELNARRRAQVG